MSADVGLPFKHKYSSKWEPEIDHKGVQNKKRLPEERFEYSGGRISAIQAHITLHYIYNHTQMSKINGAQNYL